LGAFPSPCPLRAEELPPRYFQNHDPTFSPPSPASGSPSLLLITCVVARSKRCTRYWFHRRSCLFYFQDCQRFIAPVFWAYSPPFQSGLSDESSGYLVMRCRTGCVLFSIPARGPNCAAFLRNSIRCLGHDSQRPLALFSEEGCPASLLVMEFCHERASLGSASIFSPFGTRTRLIAVRKFVFRSLAVCVEHCCCPRVEPSPLGVQLFLSTPSWRLVVASPTGRIILSGVGTSFLVMLQETGSGPSCYPVSGGGMVLQRFITFPPGGRSGKYFSISPLIHA